MSYVDGFVIPIPKKNVDDYKKMAKKARKVWMDHGAVDYKECVLEDAGKNNDMCGTFPGLFDVKKSETVVFAYIVYKSRAHRDKVNKKIMTDKRMDAMCENGKMPFDPKRMAYGGFKTIVE